MTDPFAQVPSTLGDVAFKRHGPLLSAEAVHRVPPSRPTSFATAVGWVVACSAVIYLVWPGARLRVATAAMLGLIALGLLVLGRALEDRGRLKRGFFVDPRGKCFRVEGWSPVEERKTDDVVPFAQVREVLVRRYSGGTSALFLVTASGQFLLAADVTEVEHPALMSLQRALHGLTGASGEPRTEDVSEHLCSSPLDPVKEA